LRANLAALALGVALGVALAAHAAGPQLDSNAPIHLDARSSDVDYKNGVGAFHAVKISQGAFSIEADEGNAVGLDFVKSDWTFHGNVKIAMPDGSIASDAARISFANNQIVSAQITGAPAVFEQRRDKHVARGRAAQIDYDVPAQTVKLSNGATLSVDDHDISARTLIYDMGEQKLRANPEEQEGTAVSLTFDPKKPAIKLTTDPKPKP